MQLKKNLYNISLAGLFLAVGAAVAVPVSDSQINLAASASESMDDPPSSEQIGSDETSVTFRDSNGTYHTRAFGSPVNYQDESGSWVPIDNDLVPAAGDQFSVENAANDYTVKIPENPRTTPVKFVYDGEWVSMRMRGLGATAPHVQDDVAVFSDVPAAESVEYQATSSGLKESILLNEPPTSDSLQYVYDINTSSGLVPRLDPSSNEIFFVTADGDVPLSIPAGVMFDSAETPAESNAVVFSLSQQGTVWKLTVDVDVAWLLSADRVYPVTVDPSLQKQSASLDCWIGSAGPGTSHCGSNSYYIKVGQSDSSHQYRGLLHFPSVLAIPVDATVSSAVANLYLDASQSLNSNGADWGLWTAGAPYDSRATWNSPNGGASTWSGGSPVSGTQTGTRTLNGGSSGYRTFDVTSIISGWISGASMPAGLVLKQSGSAVNQVLSFVSSASGNPATRLPYIDVTYTVPAPPDNDVWTEDADWVDGTVFSDYMLASQTVASSSDPFTVRFTPTLAEGESLAAGPNGTVVVRASDGGTIGSYTASAKDATGAAVPSSIAVTGGDIFLKVTPAAGTAYPLTVAPNFALADMTTSSPGNLPVNRSGSTVEYCEGRATKPYVGLDPVFLKIEVAAEMWCNVMGSQNLRVELQRHYKPAGTVQWKWISVGTEPAFSLMSQKTALTLMRFCSSEKRSQYRVKLWGTSSRVGNLEPYPGISDSVWRKCFVKKGP